ncbi:MAG: helix-turn-helix transcriptional regulator [Planctomycetes bacterium]|nr:helix-turn-helix transcriptional regulator [Planctomycetota bacterium]
MRQSALALLARLHEVIPHGTQKLVAKQTGISVSTLGRWGMERGKRWQFPTVHEVQRLAEVVGCSACWLAFGLGPKDLRRAEWGLRVGVGLERNPELAGLVAAYLLAPDAERANLRVWASKYASADLEQVLQSAWGTNGPDAPSPSVAQSASQARDAETRSLRAMYDAAHRVLRDAPQGSSAQRAAQRICTLLGPELNARGEEAEDGRPAEPRSKP